MIIESKYENIVVTKDDKEVAMENINEVAMKLNVTKSAIYGAIKRGTRVRGWNIKANLKKYEL